MRTSRNSRLGVIMTVAMAMSGSLDADQPEVESSPSAGIGRSENVLPITADLSKLPSDCGDQKTVIARSVKPEEPLRLDSKAVSDAEWAAYERKVRERFNLVPVPETAEEKDKPELEYVEGCALDQWEVENKNLTLNSDSEVEVFYTDVDETRTKVADRPKENLKTGSGGAQEKADSRPSSKSDENRVSIENLLDILLVQIILAVSLATALFFVLRYFVRYILGYFFRRRTCRISAELFTNKFSFSGHILILGKKGCRFIPEDYVLMEQVLDIPEFLKFSISAGGVTKSVWVNKTHGTAVAAFFNSTLSRAEQDTMLKASTIEVKFDKWRAAKISKRKGIKSVKERIARLHELREEELARNVIKLKTVLDQR